MHHKFLLLLIAPLLAAATAYGDSEHRLSGHAQVAMAEISPQSAGRRLISLPDLEFQLSVDAECDGNTRAESLSISIADTVQTHNASKMDEGEADEIAIETRIRVASSQIAPIGIERFCTGENDDSPAAQALLVTAAFAANISLRCSSEDAQSVRYASLPLEIRLICVPLDDEPSDRPPDQESSASGRRF
jgi:hypothetical protein